MSRSDLSRSWGPSHQHRHPPKGNRWKLKLGAIALILIAFELFAHRVLQQGAIGAASSTLRTIGRDALILGALWSLFRAVRSRRLTLPFPRRRSPATRLADRLASAEHPGEAIRAHVQRLGGGAFLGFAPGGSWVTADPEHAVMVLGPPRSGKTSSIVIPAMLAAPGAAVSTATKRDVLEATWRARAEIGQVWLFDPMGEQSELPRGIRRLSWSPVSAASTWDEALITARAMAACTSPGAGTTNEAHWRERSTALLAPLLFAANLGERPIAEVLRWVLRQDIGPVGLTLEDHDAEVANDVLVGIAKTDGRERSSIFSATAGVLAAYNADATRRTSATTNFDPMQFVASRDTLYVTAPAHKQALSAPLVVGLLEQIRHATYAHAARSNHRFTVFLCLDEVANVAPIHDLPALVSEAGGQGLHVMACLQDLSQARARWGDAAADGFLSLFQTKLILTGIADSRTLEAISLALGEYDRRLVSYTVGRSQAEKLLPPPGTSSESVTSHTQRHRTLPAGEIARLPVGHGLLLRGTQWGLLRLTPWHRTQPWIAATGKRSSPKATGRDSLQR
ncbi:MAG TPA: type IV secretory system conjugative DNA transfer family protein [Solirubrobacteraceae bacterium]|jgi:type IV secretory pathway TraG/TraD family ATPase VirD4|nr:type IV secretory system conjugative DNA transfer family protein [Solirubrobacteraceae bacterium]